MKKTVNSLIFAMCIPTLAFATVSINFSDAGTSTFADGFSNSAGDPTAGMQFGLVIDTSGDGFDTGLWESFDPTSSGFLTTGGGIQSNDYFLIGNNDFNGLPFETEDASGLGGDAGAIIDMFGIDVLSTNVVGDRFGIVWLETDGNAGSNYGFLDSTLSVPTDGSTVDFSVTFSGLTPGAANLILQAVPEPSTYAAVSGLLALGCVMLRRRRS